MKRIEGFDNPPVVLEDEHITIILNDLIEHHGYDFRGYSRSSLTRRIYRLMSLDEDRAVLLRNVDYVHGVPGIEQFELRFAENPLQQLEMLEDGTVPLAATARRVFA